MNPLTYLEDAIKLKKQEVLIIGRSPSFFGISYWLKYLKLFLIFISMLLFSGGCIDRNTQIAATDGEISENNGGGSLDAETRVTTGYSKFGNFNNLINVNGKIRSVNEQLIIAETSGKVIKTFAHDGAFFFKGNAIANLSTTDIQFRIENGKLKHYNSLKEYESQLAGYAPLLEGKSVAESDTIKKRLRISTGLSGAELNLMEAKNELTKSVIRAPFNGILTNVKLQEGQYLQMGQELFRIYDPANLYLEANVLEENIIILKKGLFASVTPIFAKDTFQATLFEINPYVDENGLINIKLKINLKQSFTNRLFPGMNCMATIEAPETKSVLVPKEAVVNRNGRAVVFTIENGKAIWNYVKAGKENGNEIEILEGLLPDKKVITSNNAQLSHDASVIEEK